MPISFTSAEIKAYYAARTPALDQQRSAGGQWRGPCPVHQGKNPSFAVDPQTGQAFCHSKCGRGWSLVELERELGGGTARDAIARIRELAGMPAPNGPKRIAATYDYTDEDGKLLFQTVRFEPKEFKQRRPDGKGGWFWNLKGVRLVLFRLPKLLAADRVLVVEGEKDVLTLERLGYTATTAPMGAGKWRDEYSAVLEGKHVVILPDNDARGLRHARMVRESVAAAGAASARIVELPGLPDKGDVTDWFAAGGTKEDFERAVAAAAEASAEPPVMAELKDFQFDDRGGVYWLNPRFPDQKPIWVCGPLQVLAITRDFENHNYGRLVSFRDAENHERRAVIPHLKLIADGNEAVEQLVWQGFSLNRKKLAREALKDFIWRSAPGRKVRVVLQIGWHHGCFVLPDRTIGHNGEDILFQPPDVSVEHKIRQAGTLEVWRDQVARYCVGNSRLAFAVSAAFAAALLSPLQHEGTGFHLRGMSSTGKTTALRVAGSVWGGGGEHGYIDTWRGTANGLEGKAAFHNHALLCLDEISQADDRDIGDVIYLLSNGHPKNRMTKQVTMRPAAAFRLLYLSTGERSFEEMMMAAGRRPKGGQQLRLADIPADAGCRMGVFEDLHDFSAPDQLARHLIAATSKVYGVAILGFLERLVSQLADSRNRVRHLQQQFVSANVPEASAGEVYRVASTFGLVAGAGELASDLGITGWPVMAAARAVQRCFVDWLAARGSTGALDVEYGIQRIREFIAQNTARFQEIGAKDSPAIRDRAGFKEIEGSIESGETCTYYIHPNVFREVCGAYDHESVYKEMIRRGYAPAPKEARHLTARKRVAPHGNLRFFVALPTLFEDDEK